MSRFISSYDPPAIAEHAYRRAEERMGLHRPALQQWVKSTYAEWLPVSPPYLWDRDVRCSNSDGSTLYVCPWTPAKGIALPVSRDHCLKTIMVFNETPTPKPLNELEAEDGIGTDRRLLLKSVIDKTAPNGFVLGESAVTDLVRRVLSTKDMFGDTLQQTIAAYVEGRITFGGLRSVSAASFSDRPKALEKALVRHAPPAATLDQAAAA